MNPKPATKELIRLSLRVATNETATVNDKAQDMWIKARELLEAGHISPDQYLPYRHYAGAAIRLHAAQVDAYLAQFPMRESTSINL